MKTFNYVVVFLLGVLLTSALFIVPVDSDKVNNFDEQEVVEQEKVDFSTKTISCIGDSITYGNSKSYCDYIRGEIGLKYSYKCAVSGATLSSHDLERVILSNTYLTAKKTDIITLLAGFNDWENSLPLGTIDDETNDTVYGALNVIASGLKRYRPDSYIIFMSPLKSERGHNENSAGYTLEDVAVAVEDICEKYDIAYLDLYHAFDYDSSNYSDGVHPTMLYHEEVVTPKLAGFIKQNYK